MLERPICSCFYDELEACAVLHLNLAHALQALGNHDDETGEEMERDTDWVGYLQPTPLVLANHNAPRPYIHQKLCRICARVRKTAVRE